MNSLNAVNRGETALDEELTKLTARVKKQRPRYSTRVDLLERAAAEKYPYAKLIEMRRFSNGTSINHPNFFQLLHNNQWRLFSIWLNF